MPSSQPENLVILHSSTSRVEEKNYSAEELFQLARKLLNDDDINKDEKEAIRLLHVAAARNHAESQFYLGWRYENGWGVEKNEEKAVYFYRLAADQAHAGAQNNLGTCYEKEQGVKRNVREAVYYYRLAVEQGNPDAEKNMRRCYKRSSYAPDAVYYAALVFKEGEMIKKLRQLIQDDPHSIHRILNRNPQDYWPDICNLVGLNDKSSLVFSHFNKAGYSTAITIYRIFLETTTIDRDSAALIIGYSLAGDVPFGELSKGDIMTRVGRQVQEVRKTLSSMSYYAWPSLFYKYEPSQEIKNLSRPTHKLFGGTN